MKKLLYITLLALVTAIGCKPQEKPLTLEQKLCNEWRGSELSVDAAIYISFLADRTFELYQKMEDEFELSFLVSITTERLGLPSIRYLWMRISSL